MKPQALVFLEPTEVGEPRRVRQQYPRRQCTPTAIGVEIGVVWVRRQWTRQQVTMEASRSAPFVHELQGHVRERRLR
jgi:hypothetical protein